MSDDIAAVEGSLDEQQRRDLIHYEIHARAIRRDHWVDAGAQHAPHLLRLRDLGLVELDYDTGEQWAKARIAEAGRPVAARLIEAMRTR